MLTRLLGALGLERKSTGARLSDPAALSVLFGGADTHAGVSVSPETAIKVPAAYSAIRCIAESVAQLPLTLFQTDAHGAKTKATGHPLYSLLGGEPNDWTTSYEFRLQMTAALLIHGNAYAWINRAGDQVAEIIQLPNSSVAVEFDQLTLEPFYRVTNADGGQTVYGRNEILHLRLLGHSHSAVGLAPLACAREAVGLALALEEHGAKLFGNGARPAGLFKIAGKLSKETYERLKSSFAQNYGGGANSGKTAVLEEGMSFEPLTFSSTDAQFLEMRKFQVEEIARVLRIPLHKIGALDRSTNNNIETQSLEFVTDCLMPILRLWQGAIRLSLFTKEERKTLCVEFDLDDLVKADIAARFSAYQVGVLNGILSPNEVRERESLPPYVGGDQHRLPLNTSDASGIGAASMTTGAAAPPLSKMDSQPAGAPNNA